MSHSNPSFKRSESQRRITNVVDYTNIDDFFYQPSPHELTATSERRVQEIIEDLKRRTVEELKSWSWNSPIDEDFEAAEVVDHAAEKNNMTSQSDMVSSPVSLSAVSSSPPSSPPSSTESNCPAAIPSNPKIQSHSKSDRPTRLEASTSSPQDKLLRASNGHQQPNSTTTKIRSSRDLDLDGTSSRPLAVKRRAKIPPPIPIIARDFAYQYPKTPLENPRTPSLPPPVTPATPSRALQQIAQAEQTLSQKPLPKLPTAAVSQEQVLTSSVEGSAVHDTNTNLLLTLTAAIAPLRIKRKPLPADSPLFVPLKEHPAFASIEPGRHGSWV